MQAPMLKGICLPHGDRSHFLGIYNAFTTPAPPGDLSLDGEGICRAKAGGLWPMVLVRTAFPRTLHSMLWCVTATSACQQGSCSRCLLALLEVAGCMLQLQLSCLTGLRYTSQQPQAVAITSNWCTLWPHPDHVYLLGFIKSKHRYTSSSGKAMRHC